ncbi:TauD/TfdA family dioxygenase [Olivibacter sp. CPCC 100613]|uniref:TauD/TfdA dioxygenase family protein n=1 Tax=Olivibacter sp. CPCC 100613 TaxID=3079931 RepID=UPI002FFB3C49
MEDPIKTFEYKGKESAWPFCHLEGFGLELDGVDLKKVTADEIDFIKHTLARESMIIFKNQALDDADLLAFAERVGNGKLEPSASKINHGRRIKEIGYITNLMDGEGQPLGFYKNTTDFWHSDQEFREHPASIGILFCLIPPERGGETSFASTSAELFSEEELAVIRPLLGSRVPADFHDNIKHQMVAHPVVVTNPQTHRSYVYVSENTIDLKKTQFIKDSIDVWSGRLFADRVLFPTTTSMPDDYHGLPSGYASKIDKRNLSSLFVDPVKTHEQVMKHPNGLVPPKKSGVPENRT